ncbi:MAG: hypothetical protein R6X03_05080, partial [Methyloceanibacter sp.]
EAEAPARIEELRHAKEEGIEFFFLHGPVEILTSDDGNVRGIFHSIIAKGSLQSSVDTSQFASQHVMPGVRQITMSLRTPRVLRRLGGCGTDTSTPI